MKRLFVTFLGLVLCFSVTAPFAEESANAAPRNIIFFIGDGMGPEQVKAGSYFVAGTTGALSFESFPVKSKVTTHSANNEVTDSAAAGSAMATGHKVDNYVISSATPGDGKPLETLVEFFQKKGKSTGIVTSDTLVGATPGSFGAHARTRGDVAIIGRCYIEKTKPDVLMGGGIPREVSAEDAAKAGYTVVQNAQELKALDTEKAGKVAGLFGDGPLPFELDGLGDMPHLSEITAAALNILDNDPDGFFIMIEGAKIDHAGHENNLAKNVRETAEFSKSVQVALDWARDRKDTLIIVTADHETGGLEVLSGKGKGVEPEVKWHSKGHTATQVPVYAWGAGSKRLAKVKDNTDYFNILTQAPAAKDQREARKNRQEKARAEK